VSLLQVKTSVLSVLSFLRTLIAMMVGGFVWVLVNNALGQPAGAMVLLPVWIAGLAGGAVCTMYSARQGVAMAAVSGLLLALVFLWFRHIHLALPITGGALVALWPLWFPPAYYLGAYAYVLVLLRSER
jgi:ammonia channel protein AmtB|tara:strand:+ start:420 stop:806 length:387 start_codon:yes stop_codon:yes gene_type:complete